VKEEDQQQKEEQNNDTIKSPIVSHCFEDSIIEGVKKMAQEL